MQKPQQAPATGAKKGYSAVGDSFGLLGLQSVVMQPPDTQEGANMLTLMRGFDLATLGLHVVQSEPIHPTMASPWLDAAPVIQPDFAVPACYAVQSPRLSFQAFQKFQLETLFYVFYSMPRDVLQVAAAQELYNRDWRFHKTQQLWLTKILNKEPTVKHTTFEKGTYKVFNAATWAYEEREDFVLEYSSIEEMKAPVVSSQQQQQQPSH
jgi:CCR4-NOT transcription complex subunit 2